MIRRIRKIPAAGNVFYPNLCDDCTLFTLKVVPLKEVILLGKKEEYYYLPYITPYDIERALSIFTTPDVYKDVIGSYQGESYSGGGGGGGNDNNTSSEPTPKIKPELLPDFIKDTLTNRCFKEVLYEAPNLNNNIAKLLLETFGTNDKFNITFHNKSFMATENDPKLKTAVAYTHPRGGISNGVHTVDCDVYLNDDILEKSSKEFLIATVYHEVIHAFLTVELQTLGQKAFNQKYPSVYGDDLPTGNGKRTKFYVYLDEGNHNKFSVFIEDLAKSIISFNPNIPLKTARAMAKAGIVEEESLSFEEQELNNEHKEGRRGSKCP